MPRHDIIIVGGGLAGLRAALELKGKCDCAVICKRYPDLSHSGQAQGGINAAIDPADRWEDHAHDTVYGGDFLCDQDAVEMLCREAPGVIRELAEYGVNFNRTKEGGIAQRPFGAQRFPRTCFAADRTGHALLHTMYKRALEAGVVIYNEWQAVALAKDGGRAAGVIALDLSAGSFEAVEARAVILATGGAGRVYGKTTNPENTGDGIAIAYEAGAALMDMEMIQFHPTTLRGSNKLLSEAARGEGAYLLNAKGERFMARYAPGKLELAPRDVVTRAEAMEIAAGRGVMGDSVYLDFRHMDPEVINTHLPDIRKNALELAGIDISREPVPVQPGQHYTMAGIATDTDCMTTIPGLFAAGECACVSVHGANRVGGNSLMDTFVFGRRAARAALAAIKGRGSGRVPQAQVKAQEKMADSWMREKQGRTPRELRLGMGRLMDELAGPFREEKNLRLAEAGIARLGKVQVGEHTAAFNAELQAAFETRFMLAIARCIVESALCRKESRGAHHRTDFPDRDDKLWLKHILCQKGAEGPRLSYRDVKITGWKPAERHY